MTPRDVPIQSWNRKTQHGPGGLFHRDQSLSTALKWLRPINNSAKQMCKLVVKGFPRPRVETPSCRKVLICMHGIGANHKYFLGWGGALDFVGVEMWAVCLPGRGDRHSEPAVGSVHTAAGCIGDSIDRLGLLSEQQLSQQSIDGLNVDIRIDKLESRLLMQSGSEDPLSAVQSVWDRNASVIGLFGHCIGGMQSL